MSAPADYPALYSLTGDIKDINTLLVPASQLDAIGAGGVSLHPDHHTKPRSNAMSNLAYRAMMFAREAHKHHVRKYTGNPYSDHLAEVAGIVATVDFAALSHQVIWQPTAIAVAWLHDCVEDCGVKLKTIEDQFGIQVAIGVSGLSDLETGNRAERKKKSRERLTSCSGWIQTIKCADLISNTSSIVMHDSKFAVTYLEEKRLLLDVLTKADPRLLALARQQAVTP